LSFLHICSCSFLFLFFVLGTFVSFFIYLFFPSILICHMLFFFTLVIIFLIFDFFLSFLCDFYRFSISSLNPNLWYFFFNLVLIL
jgi:hypothetical protein